MSEPESEPEELMDIASIVEPSGLVEEDPAHDTDRTDPVAALERSVQFKARLFVMVCTLCAVVSLIVLLLGLWPFDS